MPSLSDAPPAALAVPADLLDDAELGILHFRPLYGPGDPAGIIDLAYLRLNPAARRLLQLPAVPAAAFRTLHPQAEADFAFYLDAFLAAVCTRNLNYPSGWRARARRHGTELAVSLTATLPPPGQLRGAGPHPAGGPAPEPGARCAAPGAGPNAHAHLPAAGPQIPV